MKLYMVRTTFLGADRPSEIYFDTMEKAQKFLECECRNGEIIPVEVSDNATYRHDGCSYCDLKGWEDKITIEEVED